MNAPDTPFPFDPALDEAAGRLEAKVIAGRGDLHR